MELYNKFLINMREWIDIINSQKTFIPKVIMEIGSLDGKDAEELALEYKSNDVMIFEAHPIFYQRIKEKYKNFSVFNIAGSNSSSEIDFNGVDENDIRTGISSIHERKDAIYKKYRIKAERLDKFIEDKNISGIDLLKIDVEGHSYELLEGFGEKLRIIKSIHIENEHISIWENQKLYPDVEKHLVKNGFILVRIKCSWPQSDSVWIRNDLFNKLWYKNL